MEEDKDASKGEDEMEMLTLKCSDGEKVTCEKSFLTKMSPVFKKMIDGDWKESRDEFVMVDWNSEVVKDAVKMIKHQEKTDMTSYWYSFPVENFQDIFELAVYYGAESLLNACAGLLECHTSKVITPKNFFSIYELASEHDVFGIVHECLTYSRKQVFELIVDEDFVKAHSTFMERGKGDKAVFRFCKYLKGNAHRGTGHSGDPAMMTGPCKGCPWCKAMPDN